MAVRTTLFVTGATGMIGKALVPKLLEERWDVRALVRDTARSPAGVLGVAGVLEDGREWHRRLRGADVVVHLAARVHVMREDAPDPLQRFREVNCGATLQLAEAAALAGVRRFIFMSSIKVNGERTTLRPFRSGDQPAPGDPYGISKWEAEQGLRAVAARTGLEVVVLRPPLVHGPGAGGNLRRLLGLIDAGIPLPFGGLLNRRAMIGVDNLAELISLVAVHPRAPGGTFLAADREVVSTPELIRLLAAALGKRPRLFSVPPLVLRVGGALAGRADEIARLVGSLEVDTADTVARLGWEPRRPLTEGLLRMARAWKETR